MKRLFCVLAVSLLVMTCGCSQNKTDVSEISGSPSSAVLRSDTSQPSGNESASSMEFQSEVSRFAVSYQVKDIEKPAAEAASMTSPLSSGQWGTAAKYCTKDGLYHNVSVRITSIRRGDAVTKEVLELAKKSGVYLFDTEEYEEYAIADYEISLEDFPVSEGGTLCDITAFITGEDGQMLSPDGGGYWGTTAVCLDQDTYYYEGIVHSQMAFKIIKNRTDYLITLGEYGETQTYFKGE